jgi:glycosyltransferase involved in cell wall biosynthesis
MKSSSMDFSHRILLVSTDSIPPAPTGSGNQAIRWGLIDGLRKVGAEIAFCAAGIAENRRDVFEVAEAQLSLGEHRFLYDMKPSSFEKQVVDLVDTFKPTTILAYGIDPLKRVKRLGLGVPIGIMSVDLEHLPILYRQMYNLQYGRLKQKIKSIVQTPIVLWDSLSIRREITSTYPHADFVINHAQHHAAWHRRTHGRPTLYTPNPLATLSFLPVHAHSQPARFSLIGGIGGIATLTGLGWFADHVYPLIEPALRRGDFEIHLVGKGAPDPSIDRKLRHVIRRGFVEDLTEELKKTSAVLVPTPIKLGFRTRIIDSFRHGIPVIAHAANKVGMPELTNGRNCLIAETGQEFAQAILELARSPELARTLGQQAYDHFRFQFSAEKIAVEVLRFIENCIRAK